MVFCNLLGQKVLYSNHRKSLAFFFDTYKVYLTLYVWFFKLCHLTWVIHHLVVTKELVDNSKITTCYLWYRVYRTWFVVCDQNMWLISQIFLCYKMCIWIRYCFPNLRCVDEWPNYMTPQLACDRHMTPTWWHVLCF